MHNKINLKLAAVVALALTGSVLARAITVDYVSVGYAGNAADSNGYGAVAYDYQIGKYEVTNTQYAGFLNAVAATDTYGLYYTGMGSSSTGGITRSGTSGSYTYSIKSGYENKPVHYVSFWNAARFANWLNNGQGSASTETGSYNLGGVVNPTNSTVTRDSGGSVVLASENEWYKAAYYQPAAQGGPSDSYWLYPNKSETITAADANFLTSNVTNVGSYAGDASFFGTFDQGGNVWEWTDTIKFGANRVVRGGSWGFNYGTLASSYSDFYDPTTLGGVGIRLAMVTPDTSSIPEPSTYGGIFGGACLGFVMLRKRRRG